MNSKGEIKINPSGYRSSVEDFAKQFAQEMEPRLGVPCKVEFANQTEFPEPLERHNPDDLPEVKSLWDEKKSWDELAEFYKTHYSK